MPQKDKGGFFVKFPLDDDYVKALHSWKQHLETKGEFKSLREILEREIIKLERTHGIRHVLQLDRVPLVYDPPNNCQRIPVRLRNEDVISSIYEASEKSNRSLSKVMYTLVRITLNESPFAPFTINEHRQSR